MHFLAAASEPEESVFVWQLMSGGADVWALVAGVPPALQLQRHHSQTGTSPVFNGA